MFLILVCNVTEKCSRNFPDIEVFVVFVKLGYDMESHLLC